MIKVKDGYGKLIDNNFRGVISLVLSSDGGNIEYSTSSKANTLVQRNSSGLIESTLTTDSKLSPFKITSTYLNTNLNADLLDGIHASGLFTALSSSATTNLSVTIGGTTKNITNLYSGYLRVQDIRGTNHAPNATVYPAQHITGWFNNTGTPSSSWYSGIAVRGWTEAYTTWQLASYADIGTTNSYNLYFRHGNSSWGSWKTILDSSNYKDVIGAGSFWKVNALTYNGSSSSISSGDIYLEMWRGSYTSWKMLNTSGILKFQSNYTSTVGSYYDCLTITYNSGNTWIKGNTSSNNFISRAATGTQPYACTSTTVNNNLNADMLDGWHLDHIIKDGFIVCSMPGLSSYWFKVWDMTVTTYLYNDIDINLFVHSAYNKEWGIISFRLRLNSTSDSKNISAYLTEVVGNVPLSTFRLYYNNSSGYCLLWCNTLGQYRVYNYRVLAKTTSISTEHQALGTFYSGYCNTAQTLPSDSYVTMTGLTIVNTASEVANALTFAAGKFSTKTYNGSAAVTVNIPTNTSHLTNDSGFWTGTRYWANIAVSTSSSTSTSPTFATVTMTRSVVGGYNNTSYALSTGSFICNSWVRTVGNTGWYNETYGGGWYMKDTDYIRVFNDRRVYTANTTLYAFYTAGGMTAYGNIYAAHFYENSDISLKTNIQAILNSENMPQIKEFDWKKDGTHGYGFIAQELEELGYSELLDIKEDGTKTVHYSAALSLVVGKLQVKIKELEKEIENLKNKN